MLEESESIGRRIKRARLRLGLTQADFAARLKRTQGWVSKVERGRIELDRAGLVNEVAAALHVHPNDLIERPFTGSAAHNQWQVAAAMIVRELRRYDLAPVFDGPPRPSPSLWRHMATLHRLRDEANNTAIMRELPDLLREARALAETSDGREREEAFAIYSLTFSTGNVLVHAVSVALDANDQRRALALNREVGTTAIAALPASRRGHHRMDLAQAYLWDGNRAKALEELEEAERIAPQLIRNHPIARATLRRIVYAERTVLRERLRRMSDRFHLDD